MSDTELVVGIDLGTTNSEIAALLDGQVRVLGPEPRMLPSCVGLSPAGELLVGQEARNQHLLYPERTVRSIKRKMGSDEKVALGEKRLTPQEISALILRELAEWARRDLGEPVRKAVISVPAYFSDAQRSATREAGALAGLDVVRILNEPTAASLAHGFGDGKRRTVMVYDLGGGTFDVSLVTIEGDVTEVLASHGNNHLGGDDFDDLLLERLEREFQNRYGIDLRQGHSVAHARLWWAAEEAKKKLSFEPYARVREEALIMEEGRPLHLDCEISREEYESMIRPLVDSTLDSVAKALADAGKLTREIDAIVLVGGSTRTPLVARLLEERTGLEPLQDVHPDLCVALGAGVLASRLGGHEVERVLVDVSPYSFGPSHLGMRGGVPYPHCYRPIIRRNTPLPVTRTESYYTVYPGQTSVEIEIFQGDDEDALKNIPVGRFRVDGLRDTGEDNNEVLCRMSVDVDGILHVTAIEKETGKSKQITIRDAFASKSPEEIAAARKRLEELYASRLEEDLDEATGEQIEPLEAPGPRLLEMSAQDLAGKEEAEKLLERSRGLLGKMHADDVEEAVALHERIAGAIAARDAAGLEEATAALRELLFFLEGR